MARKHRKLFPDPAITSTNQTQECSDFCEPACPNYNCYAYPYYYFSSPPISADNHSSPGNHISSNLIILASLFTFIFVLVGFYMIKVKCYAHWCGWRVNRSAPSQSDNYSEDEFLNENQVDHPIWLITTIGLQKSIINSITVCKYRKGEGLIEGTECSVCLSEFQEDETLRLLPKCNHAFHIPCIDTWLRSHTNCPLCRAGILSNNVSPEAAMSNLASLEQNGASLRINQETQMENTRNDGEVNSNILVIVNGASENRARTGEAGEDEDFTDESNSKERANLNENQQVLNDEIQTEPGSDLVDDTEQFEVNILKQDGDCSTMFERIRRSSIVGCLHISPVSMKRSFSCSGRILSTKCYRNLNSTLPH